MNRVLFVFNANQCLPYHSYKNCEYKKIGENFARKYMVVGSNILSACLYLRKIASENKDSAL